MSFETATSWDICLELSAYMLGYGDETSPEKARDRLQSIGQYDPREAQHLERKLMTLALRVIAGGHSNPKDIASAALVVTSAEFPRGYAA